MLPYSVNFPELKEKHTLLICMNVQSILNIFKKNPTTDHLL